MKIIINTNPYIRKLVAINNLFGPPDSIARKMLQDPGFFGKDFIQASRIYSKMNEQIVDQGQNKFWKSFLDKTIKTGNLYKLLDELNIPLEEDKSPKIKKIASGASKNFSKLEPEIKRLLKSVFGFNLPSKIDLVVDVAASNYGANGSSLCYDPIILSIRVPSYKAKITTLILHELLHSAINSSKIVPEKEKIFTEALISYFAPSGIIDEELGILKKSSVGGIAQHIKESQPFYAQKAEILQKPIEKYRSKYFDKITVWKFLKSEGFDFINC